MPVTRSVAVRAAAAAARGGSEEDAPSTARRSSKSGANAEWDEASSPSDGADAPGRRALEDAAGERGGGDVSVDLHRRAVGREIDRDGGDAVDVAQRPGDPVRAPLAGHAADDEVDDGAGGGRGRRGPARAGVHDVEAAILDRLAERRDRDGHVEPHRRAFRLKGDGDVADAGDAPQRRRHRPRARAAHHALDAEDGGRLAGVRHRARRGSPVARAPRECGTRRAPSW